jgi:hypothetical protein
MNSYIDEVWESFNDNGIWHVIVKNSKYKIDDDLYTFKDVCTVWSDNDGLITNHIVNLHNKAMQQRMEIKEK